MPKEQETNKKQIILGFKRKTYRARHKRESKRFQRKGFRGLFLHARAGLKSAYLSEEWFAAIGYAVDEAEKCGLEAWLYDEDGWPSGFAGGRVNGKGEDYCQKSLTARNLPKEFYCEMKNAEIDDKNFLAGFSSGRPEKFRKEADTLASAICLINATIPERANSVSVIRSIRFTSTYFLRA